MRQETIFIYYSNFGIQTFRAFRTAFRTVLPLWARIVSFLPYLIAPFSTILSVYSLFICLYHKCMLKCFRARTRMVLRSILVLARKLSSNLYDIYHCWV